MPVLVAEALVVDGAQRAALEVMDRSSSLAHRHVVRARALLLAADVECDAVPRVVNAPPGTRVRMQAALSLYHACADNDKASWTTGGPTIPSTAAAKS